MKKPLLRHFRRSSLFGCLCDQQVYDAFRLAQRRCRITQLCFQTTSSCTRDKKKKLKEKFMNNPSKIDRREQFVCLLFYYGDLHSTHSWSNWEFLSNALNPANSTPRPSNKGRKNTCVLRWIDLPNFSRHFCSQALNRTAHKRPTALPCNSINNNVNFFQTFIIWRF